MTGTKHEMMYEKASNCKSIHYIRRTLVDIATKEWVFTSIIIKIIKKFVVGLLVVVQLDL